MKTGTVGDTLLWKFSALSNFKIKNFPKKNATSSHKEKKSLRTYFQLLMKQKSQEFPWDL